MSNTRWLAVWACACGGAALLGSLAYPVVGSGKRCEGIGFGCTPERELDTLLVIAVYTIGAVATLLIAGRRDRRGLGFGRALSVGAAVTLCATGAALWSQLPRHAVSPGSLSDARERWERVLADGRDVAPAGTALANALRDLVVDLRTCRDAYDRATGARTYRWSSPEGRNAYLGTGVATGAATAAAIDRWAERLRGRGLNATITDPGSDPASDRRLDVKPSGAGGGNMYVRASFYISELEITATTGCHRG